jgi:hypothetical protein
MAAGSAAVTWARVWGRVPQPAPGGLELGHGGLHGAGVDGDGGEVVGDAHGAAYPSRRSEGGGAGHGLDLGGVGDVVLVELAGVVGLGPYRQQGCAVAGPLVAPGVLAPDALSDDLGGLGGVDGLAEGGCRQGPGGGGSDHGACPCWGLAGECADAGESTGGLAGGSAGGDRLDEGGGLAGESVGFVASAGQLVADVAYGSHAGGESDDVGLGGFVGSDGLGGRDKAGEDVFERADVSGGGVGEDGKLGVVEHPGVRQGGGVGAVERVDGGNLLRSPYVGGRISARPGCRRRDAGGISN